MWSSGGTPIAGRELAATERPFHQLFLGIDVLGHTTGDGSVNLRLFSRAVDCFLVFRKSRSGWVVREGSLWFELLLLQHELGVSQWKNYQRWLVDSFGSWSLKMAGELACCIAFDFDPDFLMGLVQVGREKESTRKCSGSDSGSGLLDWAVQRSAVMRCVCFRKRSTCAHNHIIRLDQVIRNILHIKGVYQGSKKEKNQRAESGGQKREEM